MKMFTGSKISLKNPICKPAVFECELPLCTIEEETTASTYTHTTFTTATIEVSTTTTITTTRVSSTPIVATNQQSH